MQLTTLCKPENCRVCQRLAHNLLLFVILGCVRVYAEALQVWWQHRLAPSLREPFDALWVSMFSLTRERVSLTRSLVFILASLHARP